LKRRNLTEITCHMGV